MSIIDRYLLRQFLKTFLICYLSLTGLYVVFDVFTNLDEFLRFGEKAGGLVRLLTQYYGYRSILFFDRISALLTLLSAMFTVAWIQRHNELVALMAAGFSRVRVVRPIIIASIALSFVAAGVRELVIPRFQTELVKTARDLGGDKPQDMHPRYDNQTDVFIRGKATFARQQRIDKPNFGLPPALSRYGQQLVAERAFYEPPREGRPGGYRLQQVSEPPRIDELASLELAGQPVLLTRRDHSAWIAPGECFVVSGVTFTDLTMAQTIRQFASTPQLIMALRNPSLDYGADVRVAIHSRFVQPLLDITLLFLGLPLVLSRSSRNIFGAIGICLALVAAFLLVVIGFQSLGANLLLSPSLAAWAPLFIFVPIAVGMSQSMFEY